MTNREVHNTVVLGYHSPTEWVFFPEVISLYDKIIINRDIYEKTTQKGEVSPSGYENRKSELMKELKATGILQPQDYLVSNTQNQQLEFIVDYFFKYHGSEIRQLLVYAFDAFIRHEKATLEKLVTPEDPHWKDVATQLPRLEKTKNALAEGVQLSEFPEQKMVVKRYFEDAIFTPVIFESGYNPVFQWEGYARFEEFLLSFREGKAKRKSMIKKGSELKVLKSISEVVVPFRIIRNQNEIERIIDKWKAFTSIRKYIAEMNKSLWQEIDSYDEHDKGRQFEFVNDFNMMLQIRMTNLNRQIKEIDLEVMKEKSNSFSKIARFIIATLGSVIPGTAGFAQVLDDAYTNLIQKRVKESYPALRAIFEYEQLLDTFALSGKPIAPHSKVLSEYKSIKYWDEK